MVSQSRYARQEALRDEFPTYLEGMPLKVAFAIMGVVNEAYTVRERLGEEQAKGLDLALSKLETEVRRQK